MRLACVVIDDVCFWVLRCFGVNLISRIEGFCGHHEVGHASHGGVVCPVFLVRKHLNLLIVTLMVDLGYDGDGDAGDHSILLVTMTYQMLMVMRDLMVGDIWQ